MVDAGMEGCVYDSQESCRTLQGSKRGGSVIKVSISSMAAQS